MVQYDNKHGGVAKFFSTDAGRSMQDSNYYTNFCNSFFSSSVLEFGLLRNICKLHLCWCKFWNYLMRHVYLLSDFSPWNCYKLDFNLYLELGGMKFPSLKFKFESSWNFLCNSHRIANILSFSNGHHHFCYNSS